MLNPVKNTRVYEVIMDQIKDIVKKGKLKPGDKLPSERELAETLKVSRTSVREALKSLAILGLIESKHGGGNFIKNNFEDSLLEPLSIAFLLMGSKNEDILQIRKIIEPQGASLAAQTIKEDELIELRNIMEEINNTSDIETCVQLDRKFHYNIIKAAGNNLISTIMFSISELIEKYIDSSHIYSINKEIVKKQHEEIYEALKKGDSQRIIDVVNKHLQLGDNISKL